jgi:hypothetical protein
MRIYIISALLLVLLAVLIFEIFDLDTSRSITIILFWICSPLLGLGCFFSFLICTHSVGILGRGISLSEGLYLHTEQHKHRIKAVLRGSKSSSYEGYKKYLQNYDGKISWKAVTLMTQTEVWGYIQMGFRVKLPELEVDVTYWGFNLVVGFVV